MDFLSNSKGIFLVQYFFLFGNYLVLLLCSYCSFAIEIEVLDAPICILGIFV